VSPQRALWRLAQGPSGAPCAEPHHQRLRAAASAWRAPVRAWYVAALRWLRLSRVDIIWVGFVALNLAAMRLLPEWQTVPFLAIWVSLTAIYGFRLWRLQPTILTLAAVTLATGGIISVQVLNGQEDADYLAEVPLIALMFLVMVWHGRRRLAAMEERLAAMEEVQRISAENLQLLKQQRRFLQDASHELGTPITVALGHAELMERTVTNPVVAKDARIIADELRRLRRLATRMLLLASAGNPDFLHQAPVAVESVVFDALDRWRHAPRRWRLGAAAQATVLGDGDRLALALDALLENAIAHTTAHDQIEVSARCEDGCAVFAVTDSGCGIAPVDLEQIFHRFARASPYRSREAGGFGLGLAIVQAIAEAHHGSVRVDSTLGHGSAFELLVPLAPAPASMRPPQSHQPWAGRSSPPDAQSAQASQS
jgi:two-component system OmpR family sensor kinase